MPFIPTEQAAKVSLIGELFGQQVVNTLWFAFQGLGEPDATALGLLAANVVDWWEANIATELSADFTLVDCNATGQGSATEPSVSIGPLSVPGEVVGASLPGNVCLTVSFRTASRGRSGRGRNYVSGIAEGLVVGNAADSTFVSAMETGYGLLIGLLAPTWTWCVVSHYSNGAARSEGLTQPINAVVVVDGNVDSQRRRLTGRGD